MCHLLRRLAITRANPVWALDTTYIQIARGFVYITAVVDVNSRKVLAHKVEITLEADHAKEVIEQALHGTARPTSSTSIRVTSSLPLNSPTSCWPKAASCLWMAEGPGATTCL